MKVILGILGVLITGAQPALSARVVGNGGDVVVCRNSSGVITRVELLDFYEAETLRGITRDLGLPIVTVEEKLTIAIQRLRRLAPLKAARFEEKIRTFFSDANFLRGVTLVDIPDSYHQLIEVGCAVEQIAVQRTVRVPEDRLYTINQELWDRLDNDGRAGLILHEVVYGELSQTQSNSRTTRYFNSYLTSNRLDFMTQNDFFNLAQRIGFQSAEIGNYELSFTNIERYPSGAIRKAIIISGTYRVGTTDYSVSSDRLAVEFFESGVPKQLTLIVTSPTPLQLTGVLITFRQEAKIELSAAGAIFKISGFDFQVVGPKFNLNTLPAAGRRASVTFADTGELQKCENCEGLVLVKGVWATIGNQYTRAPHEFYSNGQIKSFTLGGTSLTIPVQGQPRAFWIQSTLAFFENGELKESYNGSVYGNYDIRGRSVHIRPIEFFPGEKLKKFRLYDSTVLRMADGRDVEFPSQTMIELDSSEAVVGFSR